jgi:hypothetical protein
MPIDTTQLLPHDSQRERLIAGLSKLIRQRTWQRFATGLFVEPTTEFFPDKIEPNIGGVRRLLYRLMVYADLGHLNPVLQLHDAGGPTEDQSHSGKIFAPRFQTSDDTATDAFSAAGWFAGIEDGNCLFGLDVQQTLDVDGLIGVLSHEVCHAYRHFFDLEVPTREIEEELTDLTTVFLGFGILSANASYRYRTGGSVEGGWISSHWSVHRSGYLTPQDFCFLLAVQAETLGFEADELSRLKGHLDTTQRSMFSAAHKLVSGRRDELRAQLGVPVPDGEWPDPAHPTDKDIMEVIERFRSDPGDDQSVLVTDIAEDTSRPTFRIVTDRAVFGALLGLAAGVAVAFKLVPGPLGVVGLLALTTLGWWLGRSSRSYLCSNPDCKADLSEKDAVCGGCKRLIAHNIKNANERLAAEEALDHYDDGLSNREHR